nr:maltase 2-like [Nomia melanderi]
MSIISRLDYIQELGVDAIWLNPIYSSPLIDSGYDVSNYTDVNPVFGNLDKFDLLIKKAHERDIKVILDIVPNHSSDRHWWFKWSVDKIEPYTNYYVWADGSVEWGKRIPPNNWVSTYSEEEGSAWTWDRIRKQWYYHKFHQSQPDLNLRSKDVIKELESVFRFWLERHVDGFRIDAVSYLFEDEDLRNEPVAGNGNYTKGLPESRDFVYRIRSYIDNWVAEFKSTSKLLIVESFDSDETLVKYYGNRNNKGIPPFNFHFITSIQNTSTAGDIRCVIQDWLEMIPNNASTNWVLSNHDNPRAASRIGLNRADGLNMLNLLLPGQAYTYYGEEIAMLDRKISWADTIDPMGKSRRPNTYEKYSRDPARTPMQWDSSTSGGFSTTKNTYLPIHPDYATRNVELQKHMNQSNLNTYKLLSTLRKGKEFTHGNYELTTINNDSVFILKRFLENYSTYVVIVNLGLRQETVNLTSTYPNIEDSMEIVVASSNAVVTMKTVSAERLILSANAAYVLKVTEIMEPDPTIPTSTTKKPGHNSAADSTTMLQLIITITLAVTFLFKC